MISQEQIELLHTVVRGGAFNVVREVFEAHIARLTSIDDVDQSLDPEALKIELMARFKAKETVRAMIDEVMGYGAQERATNALTRSMR